MQEANMDTANADRTNAVVPQTSVHCKINADLLAFIKS
jgi:hypothetical protein